MGMLVCYQISLLVCCLLYLHQSAIQPFYHPASFRRFCYAAGKFFGIRNGIDPDIWDPSGGLTLLFLFLFLLLLVAVVKLFVRCVCLTPPPHRFAPLLSLARFISLSPILTDPSLLPSPPLILPFSPFSIPHRGPAAAPRLHS